MKDIVHAKCFLFTLGPHIHLTNKCQEKSDPVRGLIQILVAHCSSRSTNHDSCHSVDHITQD